MPKNGARHQLEAMAETETAGNTLPMAQAEADAGRATSGGAEMNFPFVVKHKRLGRIGIATRYRSGRKDIFSISTVGSNNYTNWQVKHCKILDTPPSDLGYTTPKKHNPPKTPIKNVINGRVGLLYKKYYRDSKWFFKVKLGNNTSTYWVEANCKVITMEEYEVESQKTPVQRGRGGSRKRPNREIKEKRYCKKCGKLIKNGNWWYCAECHQEMIREDNRMGVDESWMTGREVGHTFTSNAKRGFTGKEWNII